MTTETVLRRVRGEDHPSVVLDIDGTVCENGHRIDWRNPQSVARLSRPFPEAQRRIGAMMAAGWRPAFLSAREDILDRVTCSQIREWFGDDVAARMDLWLCPQDLGLLTKEGRREVVVAHKASWLTVCARHDGHVGVLVGDTLWDKEAAELAGWRFMWAHEWRAGAPFHLDGEPVSSAVPLRGDDQVEACP